MATQALHEVYEATLVAADLAEVDQTGAGQEGEEAIDMEESNNESLNEDISVEQEEDVANSIYAEVDAGEDTGEDADLT